MGWENQITAELWNGYREYRQHEFVPEKKKKNGKADEIMTFFTFASFFAPIKIKWGRVGETGVNVTREGK